MTASTHLKRHHFRGADRLAVLHRGLLTVARDFGWNLEAWAVFSNHYHFVGHAAPEAEDAGNLSAMLKMLHTKTAGWVNRLDEMEERQVWFNFWETQLTFEKSYLARLNYVHRNAVKHGLVKEPNEYPWCSARWFEQESSPAMAKAIERFRVERVKVSDDFEVAQEW